MHRGCEVHVEARTLRQPTAVRSNPCFRARRWVVERSHSWLNRFRRILIRWEKKAVNDEAMLHFACAIITL